VKLSVDSRCSESDSKLQNFGVVARCCRVERQRANCVREFRFFLDFAIKVEVLASFIGLRSPM